MIRSFLCKSLLNLIFPLRCIACEESLSTAMILCKECLSHLVLLQPSSHCPRCFGPKTFHECKRNGLTRQAFCFEYSPIIEKFKVLELSKILASYLLVQLQQLQSPIDFITTVPEHPLRRFTAPFLQDNFFADHLARELSLPRREFLRAVSDEEFTPRSSYEFTGEQLLIVGFRPKSNTRRAIQVLKNQGPCKVLGLYITN